MKNTVLWEVDEMFSADTHDLQHILADFGIKNTVSGTEELLRYDYSEESREVRVIYRCDFADRAPVIVKFKWENDVTAALIEAQSRFSEHLAENGVHTARFHRCGENYVCDRQLNGYEVLVTVEDFAENEIKIVTPEIAEKTGRTLALTHNIAERDDLHVDAPVLFDPFAEWNDLFSYDIFAELKEKFTAEDAPLFEEAEKLYRVHMAKLEVLKSRPKYAIQGDISDCNLFIASDGSVGMFDFNRCGDAVLFCDLIMQGVFEAQLMDYDRELTPEYSDELFDAFLRGYESAREISDEEKSLIPHFRAIIYAFWLGNIRWGDDGMTALLEKGDIDGARRLLKRSLDRLRI